MEYIGWIGSICMSFCAVPEVVFAYKHKRTGCSWGLLVLWLIGEVGLCIFEFNSFTWQRFLNYFLNICCLIYLVRVKLHTH